MGWLIERMQEADGLVLAAPIYWLGPAAAVKLVLDRLLMVTGRVGDPFPEARPAVTIVTAGLERWRGVALPFLNALVAAFGYRPVESLVAVAPGPGEVLLDDGLMARMLEAGRRLARRDLEPSAAEPGECPICRCEAFVVAGRLAVCPICGREATLEVGVDGIGLRFGPVAEGHQRWTPEGLREHMIGWVQATGPRYMTRRAEIRERRAAYRHMEVPWRCPPSTGD
jgi:hypothetical protein